MHADGDKSVVIVFNEPKRKRTRSWYLGDCPLSEVDAVRHLGSFITRDLSQKTNIEKVCQKARGSFLGLINCGLLADGFHSLSSLKIYNSVVLPSALYGSELWCDMTNADILRLERIHHFSLKAVLSLFGTK
jgi:hypothetical protein